MSPPATLAMLRALLPLVRPAASNALTASRSARQVAQRLRQGRQWRGPGFGPSAPPGSVGRLTGAMREERMSRSLLGIRIESGRLSLPPPPPVPVPAAHPVETAVTSGVVGGLLTLVAPTVVDLLEGLAGALIRDAGRWRQRNGRPRAASAYDGAWGDWPTGTYDPNGPNVWTATIRGTGVSIFGDCSRTPFLQSRSFVLPAGHVMWLSGPGNRPLSTDIGNTYACGGEWFHQGPVSVNGTTPDRTSGVLLWMSGPGAWVRGSRQGSVTVAPLNPGVPALPWEPEPMLPLPDWEPEPFPEVEAPPPPARRPLIAPAVAPPRVPDAAPAPFTTPDTIPGPRTTPGQAPAGLPVLPRPATAPRPTPVPVPADGVRPGPGGMPAPAPAPAPSPTPVDQVVVGSPLQPVTIIPSPPPATPAGMAMELGRIERKLEVMIERPGSGPGGEFPDLQPLADAIEELLQKFAATVPGTVYTLDSPCNRDEEGNPQPPYEASVESGELGAAILARLDALAEILFQGHQIPAPTCKHARPSGQAVTVRFREV